MLMTSSQLVAVKKILSLDTETRSLQAIFDEHPDVKDVCSPKDMYVGNTLLIVKENGTWIGGATIETTHSGR